MNASITDYLKSGALYALPHHLISRSVFKLTRIESPLVPNAIEKFSKAFNVDLNEALNPDPKSYKTFNEFFTRELKPELRPLSDTNLISPVDGTVSEFGNIKDNMLLQAKGIDYSLDQLLGGNPELLKKYEDGQFITIYLSPRDYHRIHMPCTGTLNEQTHIPGRLFSVAKHTVNTVKSIFARNERVVASFNADQGAMSMVLVGAINVAAIETVWDGLITPPKGKTVSSKNYSEGEVSINKGIEMGRFNMGSTVILILDKNMPKLSSNLAVDQTLKLGQALSD